MGLYSIKLTLQGTYLQNLTKASTDSLLSLIPFQTTYSKEILLFVFRYQYSNDSLKSAKGKLALKGIILERISSIAECKETASLNFTSSSASFFIILGTHEVV